MYGGLAIGFSLVVLGLVLAWNVQQRQKLRRVFEPDSDPDLMVRREQRIVAWTVVAIGLAIIAVGIYVGGR